MADKWLSRLFGRTPTQTISSTQPDESPHVGPSPGTSPQTNSDHRQLLKDITPINGSPVSSPPQTRNLRSFDPSALNNGHSDSQSLFVNTTDASTRKRQLKSSPDGLLASERIKRFRDNIASARDDETDRLSRFDSSTVRPRMEHSFAGTLTQRNTSMLDSPGGSSTISIFSRRSTAPSTHSNVSSKTRAILEQLERVATPQTESKRVPMFRPASTVPEVWNTSWHAGTRSTISTANASPNPPPLRRQPIQIPNRMQMLNSAMTTHYKKPYWRDIYRPKKPLIDDKPSFQSPVIQRVQASSVTKVSPLFDLSDYPSPAASTVKETASSTGQQVKIAAPVKGPDGKKVPNTFNAECIFMEDSDGEQEKDVLVTVAKKLELPKVAPPQKGFISNCLFDFEAPIERGPQVHVSSEESSSESDSSDSEVEPVEVQAKSAEVKTNELQTKSNQKAATFEPRSGSATAPPTDSESSASVVATPVSSQNASPENLNKTSVESVVAPKWDCPTCMVQNEAASAKCVCCDTPKEGQAASVPALTFKPTTFAPAATGLFKFDANKTPNGISSTPGLGLTQIPENLNKTSVESVVAPKWDCPTCMVQNEAASAKCVCCDTPKEGQAASAPAPAPTPTLTFKPTTFAPATGPFRFGFSETPNGISSTPALGLTQIPESLKKTPVESVVAPKQNSPTCMAPNEGTSTKGMYTFLPSKEGQAASTPAPTFKPMTFAPATGPIQLDANKTSNGISSTPSLGLTQTVTPALDIPSGPSTSLSFGTNLAPDAAPKRFQFGPASTAPSNAPLVFGGNSTTTSTVNAFKFDGSTPAPSTTATPAQTFGSGAPAPSTIAAPAQIFGSGAPALSTIAAPAQTNGFSFGTNGIGNSLSAPSLGLPQPIAPAPLSLGVSTKPPTSFIFNNVSDTAGMKFQFGQASAAPSSTPFIFGANSATVSAANSISFGGGAPPISTIPSFCNAPPTDSPFAYSSNPATGVGPQGRRVVKAQRRLTHKR